MEIKNMQGDTLVYLFIGLLGVLAFMLMNGLSKKVKTTKEEYDIALRGTDKQAALIAGRAYYKAFAINHNLFNNNKIPLTNEQAIANDLAAMDKAN